MNYNEQQLRFVLDDISSLTGINFIYKDELIGIHSVTCEIEKGTVDNALKKILKGTEVSYKKFGEDSIVLFHKKEKIFTKPSNEIVVFQHVPKDDTTYTITDPEIVTLLNPVYPLGALINNVEGKVELKILVNKNGDVVNTLIKKSSGSPILDSSAVNYTYTLKYIPAKANGRPYKCWVSMTYSYSIKKF
ncbi:MAG: TonB family protein [Ignavibacteria bacterium]